jgi:hypothetical protein
MAGSLFFLMISSLLAVDICRASDVTVIDNINEWKHPVKDVLTKHKVILYRVELYNKTYPIFYIKLPYDPWISHNDKYFKPLYYESLKANGYCDYSFIDRSSQVKINIRWDRKTGMFSESLDEIK